MGLDYEIQFKRSTKNRAVDALSRKEQQEAQCDNITVIIPRWIGKIQESYVGDIELQEILQAKTIQPDAYPEYTFSNGIIKKGNQVYLGKNSALRGEIVQTLHSSSLGGHSWMREHIRG